MPFWLDLSRAAAGVGINCAFGPHQRRRSSGTRALCPHFVFSTNAGLPNEFGARYGTSELATALGRGLEMMAQFSRGCCGRPEHSCIAIRSGAVPAAPTK